MIREMDVSKLVDIIINNDIAIYGAGYAAENFYTALQIRKIEKRVKYFIVSDAKKAGGKIQGIPVRPIEDVAEKNLYVCIAVHEAIRKEIEDCLLEFGVKEYIWVHPYIMELAFGKPLEYHKPIETREIMQHHCNDNYAFAIRYIAIEEYYNKNNIGYDMYQKALCLQCEAQTAEKRLEKFINLIDDWDKNGYRQNENILIDKGKRLIDGTHRLSLACYHEMKYIYCDIFPYSDYYGKVVKESHFLSMSTLIKNGFTQNELEAIDWAQKEIMRNKS